MALHTLIIVDNHFRRSNTLLHNKLQSLPLTFISAGLMKVYELGDWFSLETIQNNLQILLFFTQLIKQHSNPNCLPNTHYYPDQHLVQFTCSTMLERENVSLSRKNSFNSQESIHIVIYTLSYVLIILLGC